MTLDHYAWANNLVREEGVAAWNLWRQETSFGQMMNSLCFADLGGLNLEGIDFDGLHFFETDFGGANLKNASFNSANFVEVNFEGANLEGVNFEYANFLGTKLNRVRLTDAFISYNTFYRCEFNGTDFGYSEFNGTNFTDCDLSKAIGLEFVLHNGRSNISMDTILRSSGNLPDVFLRGCGYSDTFITYSKALVTNPIELYSCFISFTEKDDLFSKRLFNDLQGAGVRCWRWKENAKWGRTLRRLIDDAIRLHDKLIVIISKDSLNSPAVLEEIERALNKEDSRLRDGKDDEVLFPIRVDDYIFEWEHYLKDRIRRKNIGDFLHWDKDPEKYSNSLKKLIDDLVKTET